MSDFAPTVIPTLRYDDAVKAIDFLCEAFGFTRHEVHVDDAGRVVHAELRHGTGMVMLGQSSDGSDGRLAGKGTFPGIYVVVDDADAACRRAREAGAEITSEPRDTDYGSRDFGAADLEGNVWWFGTYQPTA